MSNATSKEEQFVNKLVADVVTNSSKFVMNDLKPYPVGNYSLGIGEEEIYQFGPMTKSYFLRDIDLYIPESSLVILTFKRTECIDSPSILELFLSIGDGPRILLTINAEAARE